MKAVILTAGEGKRLEPLTEVRPKPMIPIANRPLLEYVVDACIDAGITDIVFVVGYKRERIQNYFGDGDNWSINIEYAVQRKQLGTGHAILQAEDYIEQPFIVLNGDRIVESNAIENLINQKPDREALVVTRSDQPSNYGVIEYNGRDITSISEKPPQYEVTSNLINAGVYLFSPDIFTAIRNTDERIEGEIALPATLNSLIEQDKIETVRYSGLWVDVSYLWDILTVNSTMLDTKKQKHNSSAKIDDTASISSNTVVGDDTRVRANATVLRGVSIGDNVEVGANAVISNSIIMSDSTIKPGTIIKDCIIAENTEIGPNTTIPGGTTDIPIDDTIHRNVDLGGVFGDNTKLGGNVTVHPGSIVGRNTEIEGGSVISDRIESNSKIMRG